MRLVIPMNDGGAMGGAERERERMAIAAFLAIPQISGIKIYTCGMREWTMCR